MPVALQIDLLLTNTIPIHAKLGGLTLNEDRVVSHVSVGETNEFVGASISFAGDRTILGLSFRLPVPPATLTQKAGSELRAFVLFRSSRAVARSAGLERFLSVSEAVKTVPVVVEAKK